MLTFDEAAHRYYWNGAPVPNVTGIIAPLTSYAMVPADALELARQKGTHVHKMVELWAAGDLDEAALPDWMRPVYEWWLKFVADSGIEIIASERKVYHPAYRYAGTLDLKCRLRGFSGIGIVDVKRSFLAGGAIGLQTAAYQEAENHGVKLRADRVHWRAALRLREDAPYRLINDRDDPDVFGKDDFQVFAAQLILNRWKETHL